MGRVMVVIAGLVLASAGVLLLLWVLWVLWQRSEQKMPEIKIERAAPGSTPELEPEGAGKALEEQATEPTVPPQADNLKRIEGIGPKISGLLQEAGIATFAQLADASAADIRNILETADPRILRLADPTSWPEQASLAASGEWEALQALQRELKAGRAK